MKCQEIGFLKLPISFVISITTENTFLVMIGSMVSLVKVRFVLSLNFV